MDDPNLTAELLSSKLRIIEMDLEYKKNMTSNSKRSPGSNAVFSS